MITFCRQTKRNKDSGSLEKPDGIRRRKVDFKEKETKQDAYFNISVSVAA